MASTRHVVLIISSTFLLLVIALSLATAVEIRAPIQTITRYFGVNVPQAARIGGGDGLVGQKALINGTGFDRGDIWHGTSLVPGGTISATASIMTETQEGLIGITQTPRPSPSWSDEGMIGTIATPTASALPKPQPQQPLIPQVPIAALSYAGAGGPKHCRGELLQKMSFPAPASQWKNGTCINIPREARCGVFFAGKDDNCEAHLFNVPDCYNTSRSYVNTVVFVPEERPVGALWSSMLVRCGVDVPPAKLLDPSILGGLLKKPAKPGAG